MSGHRPRGLASRFFLAQAIVVIASILAAVLAASLAGPAIFHEHLLRAGAGQGATQLMHVEQAYRDTNLWTLGVALATALVCALGVTWLFTRRLQRPIDALAQAAQAMARGRFDTRVPAMGAGAEVDALAGAFNTMAAQLERTEDTRRRMLSDLAHEMRTPISVLTVYLEALQDGVAHWDATTSELMGDQLARLTRLVEDIHDVSRAEEGRIVLERAEQPVVELVRAAAETHREAYAAEGVALNVDVGEAAGDISADRQRMGQVLGNLLSNALRHTPPGGQVTLSAIRQVPGRVAIRVADTGDGISPEQLPHLFERFYRGDTARDRDHGGSGIGLTISKALTEAHGGRLTAASPGVGQGAVFTVELPTHHRTGPSPTTEIAR
ncbi:HAMP domain-containing protein [Kocuria sp. JC486]|uniref:histidine kinase n=1 Tax=Kocuria soli TaxID=2485125 RepID=A0A3N3ZNC4_9MICC|nr:MULTISPECIES: ATP-binding protein [Kocuria]NHU86303.1 HAMP domain-containing protein [Kocuria sp. JC486]ROZ62292.1 HAMP domain-containing protein [Kocuria soli]